VILYDGVCGLCDRLVKFLLKRDRQARFCFAPLQGPFARDLLASRYGSFGDLDTLVVIAHYQTRSEQRLSRAAAVLFVLRELDGLWRYTRVFSFAPAFLLDLGYRWVAKSRYRLFGKYDSCSLPDTEHRSRFIDV
jgi:predicted DCC family thiol-disulfide oxidoreductase YuxK